MHAVEPRRLPGLKAKKKRSRGQSTIEYVLMVAFGAIFALQVTKFFNDIFRDGLTGLEGNISSESRSGAGFTP